MYFGLGLFKIFLFHFFPPFLLPGKPDINMQNYSDFLNIQSVAFIMSLFNDIKQTFFVLYLQKFMFFV